MWGQGLAERDRFAHLAATKIAQEMHEDLEVVPGPGSAPARGAARSGSKLKAASADGTADILLPSGGTTRIQNGNRAGFAMTFRSLFTSDAQMQAFLSGQNETPAAALFGENPATFPTVTDQIRDISSRAVGPVHLVLMDGGVNDAEFEEVLDPEGPDINKIDETIERVFGHDLPDVVGLARKAFPEALILVTGYYSALSPLSDRARLKDLFEFLSKKPEWQLALNDGVQDLYGIRDFLNGLGFTKDVDALVEKAIRRSVAAAAHAHHWSRRALGALPSSVRGPGVAFVYPDFRPEHALFAGVHSLVHSGYKPPTLPPPGSHDHRGELGGGVRDHRTSAHVVDDDMLRDRLASIPRLRLLNTYRRLHLLVSETILAAAIPETPASRSDIVTQIAPVLRETDLPSQILAAADELEHGTQLSVALRHLADALGSEIGRIETAMIASFIHPNPAGARRYADRIVTAHRLHENFSLRAALRGLASGNTTGVAISALRQHGVDLSRGLRQLELIAYIDSVALQLTGLEEIPGGLVVASNVFFRRAHLTLGPRLSFDVAIPLGVPEVLRAFDTNADVRLADITTVSITGVGPFGELVLYLNGQELLRAPRAAGKEVHDTVTFRLDVPVRDHRGGHATARDHRSGQGRVRDHRSGQGPVRDHRGELPGASDHRTH
ncbi:hypothetical protein GORHZ_159_00040 [Gordonia rhizosphera NBRC 16068]|uniref:SGNH hydrolase-type esterase domain-containing protein n=2 Tax=Gordonia rhizosphera TaxID=83341 RepID=K6V733_9ACTN|nr:hypothetical protein GORHZ_159_00040 [Gordonia rhizosphera NBRC 16068]